MRVRLTLVDPAAGRSADVVVEAAPATSLAQAREALAAAAGLPAGTGWFVDGERLEDAVLGVPPLVEGAVVTVGAPGAAAGRAAGTSGGLLELHVVSGPDSGVVVPLTPGRHRIGRGAGVEVPLADPDVSRLHAELDVGPDGVTVRDLGSTNGSRLDAAPVGDVRRPLHAGADLAVGSSLLRLRADHAARAATQPLGDGRVGVNRAPRAPLPATDRLVHLPARPDPPEPVRLPLLSMLLPLAVSVPMALLWSPTALLLGLAGPLLLGGHAVSERRAGRRRHRAALAAFEREHATVTAHADAAAAAEKVLREQACPDAAALGRLAETPGAALWQRRPGDPDDLLLRVGTGAVRARVATLPAGGAVGTGDAPQPRVLERAPVTVSLRQHAVVGLAGPAGPARALARFLVGQLACLHSPRDVRLCVLAADGSRQGWEWTGWLPHTLAPGGTTRERVDELVALLERRRENHSGTMDVEQPVVVVVLDGATELRTAPGVSRLLGDGPRHGIVALCIDSGSARLPVECAATVQLVGEVAAQVRVDQPDADQLGDAVADLVGPAWAQRLARALAPLRDTTPEPGGAGVPDGALLLDLLPPVLGGDPLDPAVVVRHWARTPRSTTALLGRTTSGVYAPDLTLAGPHVLVGGTTGSGKSELLRTLVASLAVGNRPDELVFVLVDYKGGAAFAECADLPHTAGVVTDLDEQLTRRALASLTAEVRRRERLLAAHGAADLPAYQRLRDTGHAAEPLPRLVLVVDEFRALAEELPDFVTGLVRLASVGRSLGLHLVLATQRPGGIVGPDIAANVNLRIALRVRDRSDSVEVVDAPDAAALDPARPGRAVARSGAEDLVTFQTARVGGTRAAAAPVAVRAWRADRPAPALPTDADASPSAAGDLARLAATLREAARRCGVPETPSPWLPPLPDRLTAPEAAALLRPGRDEGLVLGAVDEPELMARHALVLDPAVHGCLAVVGTTRSGRTTLLRTLATAAAARPADDLHLYVLGATRSWAAGLAALPHTGAVVDRGEAERAARLLSRLAAEVARRRDQPAAPPPAAALVLVDGLDLLQRDLEEVDGGRPAEHLQRVLTEGPAAGVVTVATGDRSLLTGRLSAAFGDRLLLRTADPTDAVLAGASVADLPRHQPPGRGLLVRNGTVRQVQVALPDDAALAGPHPGPTTPGRAPLRVRPLPARVTTAELSLPDGAGAAHGPAWTLLGVGGEEARPLGVDLAETPALLVAGPPGAGRSTTLLVLARAALRRGVPVVAVSPRSSPLSGPRPPEGVVVVGAGDAAALEAALARAHRTPPLVLVDDVEQVEGGPLEARLLRLLGPDRPLVEGVAVAGTTTDLAARFRGLAVEARRGRAGVLLNPTGYADGDLLGVAVPRARSVHPGRGVLVLRGSVQPVQVALPVD